MKLYELAAEYRQISDAIDANGGELTPELEQALDAITGTLTDKVESCQKIDADLKGEEEKFKAEAERLKNRATAVANSRKRLRDYVMCQLEIAGVDSVKTSIGDVRIARASQPKIEFVGVDVNELPDTFLRHKVEFDATAAREAVKRGDDLPPGIHVSWTRYLATR